MEVYGSSGILEKGLWNYCLKIRAYLFVGKQEVCVLRFLGAMNFSGRIEIILRHDFQEAWLFEMNDESMRRL